MRSVFILAPFLFAVSHADTIHLKDGTVIEGDVISTDADSHLVRVQVTETIRDERRIAKSDIARIVEERKDVAAFQSLKPLLPTPDLLEPAGYNSRIKQLEDFVEEFPDSDLKSEASEMITKLEQEKSLVEEGGVKFGGEMITPEERRAQAFPLDSTIAAARVERLARAGDPVNALRAWDELVQHYPTSRAFVQTVPLALNVMRSLVREIEAELATIDDRKEQRMKGLERVPANDRERVTRQLKQEAEAYLRRVAAEKENNIRWISLNPYFSVQMNEFLSLAKNEISNLENFDASSVPDGDKVWKEAWEMIHDEESEAHPSQAVSVARNARLPDKYIAILEEEAAEMAAENGDE